MPSFPLRLTPDGATLDIMVGAPKVYTTHSTLPRTWRALLDTGALMSVISPAVVVAYRPPVIGVCPVLRAGAVSSVHPTHDVRVRLGGPVVARGRWFNLEVVAIQPATPDVDVLIGMDLMIQLDMAWWGGARMGWLAY